MSKAKALRTIAEGFMQLAECYDREEVVPVVEESIEETIQESVEESVKDESNETESVEENVLDSDSKITGEEKCSSTIKSSLEEKTLNELRSLAKEYSVSGGGKKVDIISRLEEAMMSEVKGEAIEEPVSEEVEEEIVPTNEEEEETIETPTETESDIEKEVEEEVEDNRTELVDKITLELKDYSVQDIADVLSDVGISPKGKREALIDKVVQAVIDGLLEFEDDESEVEEEEVESELVPSSEEVEDTEARKYAIVKFEENYNPEDEWTIKEINERLAIIYNDPKDGYSKDLPLEEKLDMLKEHYINLIDDEGESHELQEAYELRGEYYCCSKSLSEIDEGYLCSVCGTIYETE